MTGAMIAQLLLTYGPSAIALVEKLIATWSAKWTQADIDALKALMNQTAADRMKAQLVAAGVPLDSPQALALIAQAS